MFRTSAVVASLALLQLGCAEQLQLLDRGPTGGVSPCSFWPPPPSSATWLVAPGAVARNDSLSEAAGKLQLDLRGRGYTDQRWYPIGVGNGHGFAVTTRLEQVDSSAQDPPERWSSIYPDGATLRWLQQARMPPLPGPGRYRVFLVAYTDLPIGRTASAPIWNEETVMDWPNAAERRSFPDRDALSQMHPDGYRFGIYEYEYQWDERETRGQLVQADGREPAASPGFSGLSAGAPIPIP